jgi:nitronate monooxygenase
MTAVSGPDLVIAACRMGVIGAFPTHNAPSTEALDDWLDRIAGELTPTCAPVAANLVVHRSNRRLTADLECLRRHGVELVIASVGAPDRVVGPLHDAGAQVYADVASMGHAQRALAAGVDGLVLLTAGAGGQTGWANPFAFVRAVREHYAGPLVLAGGITDGRSILAAEVLGIDLVYLGTRFIATPESMADDAYREALVASSLDDVRLSTRVGGIPASLLASWLDRADQTAPQREMPAEGFDQDRLLSNNTAWSAGHSVSGVSAVTSVADLVTTLVGQYAEARADVTRLRVDS